MIVIYMTYYQFENIENNINKDIKGFYKYNFGI